MPTALLADDEPILLKFLQEKLQLFWPELDIVATAHCGPGALQQLQQQPIDIAFLDIRMPGLSGMQVAAACPDCQVVFVTAYDEYAIAAFEQAAVDYLLKPVSDDRLLNCLKRLRQSCNTASAHASTKQSADIQTAIKPNQLRWFHVGLGQQIRLVALDEVLFFQASDKYTELVTRQETHLIRTPLKELLAQLDPSAYAQTHRSCIVCLRAISFIEKDIFGRQHIHLRERAEVLPLSRLFASQFKHM